MAERAVTEADLTRLKSDQETAGREYNDALTRVDEAIQPAPDRPAPPSPYDEFQINALNARWRILPDGPPAFGSGWRGWLARVVWQIVSPHLLEQQAFNSALVDHVNRNIEGHRQTRQAIETLSTLVRDQVAGMAHFQSMLVQYLQRVTPFVDTKDYECVGILRRLTEDNRELLDIYKIRIDEAIEELRGRVDRHDHQFDRVDGLAQRVEGFAAGLSGVSDELRIRWESVAAREGRSNARLAGLETSSGVVQRATQTLKREFERLGTATRSDGSADTTTLRPSGTSFTSSIDSYKYVGFEDQFRGSQDDIRARVTEYLPLFDGASDVLDVGCGRGEFIELLREQGVTARGLDVNHEMVAVCRARGLEADEGDALTYVSGLPDASLGGLFAAQVVEHLEPDYLLRFIDVAYHKLRPGSCIVLETINPACWYAFFESYIRDISHVRPLHPETLQYVLLASGFQRVELRYRAPYPDVDKLQPLSGDDPIVQTFNANVEKLNRLLFTYLDYAAIGRTAGDPTTARRSA